MRTCIILTISKDGQFIFQCEWLVVINTPAERYSHGIDIHCTNIRTTPPNFSIDLELKENANPEKITLVITLYPTPVFLSSRQYVSRSFSKIEEETRTGSDRPPLRSSNELQNNNVFDANLALESNACVRANSSCFLRTSCRSFSLRMSASCFNCSK